MVEPYWLVSPVYLVLVALEEICGKGDLLVLALASPLVLNLLLDLHPSLEFFARGNLLMTFTLLFHQSEVKIYKKVLQ